MIKFAVLIILVALPQSRQKKETEATLKVQDQIRLLKFSIKEQLKHIQSTETASKLPNEHYDYVDLETMPVTPIQENDERAKMDRFKLPQLKTPSTTPEEPFDRVTPPDLEVGTFEINPNVARSKHKLRKESHLFEKPVETFYRRVLRKTVEDDLKSTPLPWLHCQDIITPFLTGVKTELGPPYEVDQNHTVVERLISLLSTNTTLYSKEDIYSIMYQINGLQLRFFQWNVAALRRLFDVITKGQKHTFRKIVYGLRQIFRNWHLDYRNVTNLLKQTRIFRPYCITDHDDTSSTKSSGGTRYTKPTQSTVDSEDDCNDRKK